jgi:hypothetical protein
MDGWLMVTITDGTERWARVMIDVGIPRLMMPPKKQRMAETEPSESCCFTFSRKPAVNWYWQQKMRSVVIRARIMRRKLKTAGGVFTRKVEIHA